MNRNNQSGFTLVELLITIAIIGILATVVLSSMNGTKTKGSDATIKSNLTSMRNSAEILYSSTNNFNTVCDAGTNPGDQFRAAVQYGGQQSGENLCLSSGTNAFRSLSGTIENIGKAASTDKWAVSVRMKNGNYFCANYAGIAREQASRGIDNNPADLDC